MNMDLVRIKKFDKRQKYFLLQEEIFLYSWIILLIIHCIECTSLVYLGYSWMNILYILKKCMYLVLLAKIVFLTSGRMKELFCIGMLLFVIFISYYRTHDFGLLGLFIVVIAAKDVSVDRIIKYTSVIKAVATIGTIIAYKIGILPTLYYRNGSGYYNTLGFCHRNVLGANMVFLCLVWFFYRYKDLKKEDIFLWSVVSLVAYRLTYSRGSFVTMILIIICVCLFRFQETWILNSPVMFKCLMGGFVALIVLSIVCTIFYKTNSKFWDGLDAVFTRRFSSANYCCEKYGWTIWGQKIPFVNSFQAQMSGNTKLILDNAYARLLLYHGLIPGILVLFFYGKAIKQAYQHMDGATVVCLLIMAIYGLVERYMIDIFYQFPLFVAFQYFFDLESLEGKDMSEGRNA